MPPLIAHSTNMAGAIKGGLIGENIGRSRFSKALDIFCQRDGRALHFDLFDTKLMPDFDFDRHLEYLRGEGFTGVTVTHPFKTLADKAAGRRSGYPAELGASNLLRFDGDEIRAFNTDYTGMIAAWRSRFADAKPGLVAVAGAGGVARAVVVALVELGATAVDLWDIQDGAAERLARAVDSTGTIVRAVPYNDRAASEVRADGVVNCTPLGMREYPGSAFDASALAGRVWAFDAVYTPIHTEFMTAANASGLACLSGFDLFKHMAVRSYAAYTNTAVNPDDVALLEHLSAGL